MQCLKQSLSQLVVSRAQHVVWSVSASVTHPTNPDKVNLYIPQVTANPIAPNAPTEKDKTESVPQTNLAHKAAVPSPASDPPSSSPPLPHQSQTNNRGNQNQFKIQNSEFKKLEQINSKFKIQNSKIEAILNCLCFFWF